MCLVEIGDSSKVHACPEFVFQDLCNVLYSFLSIYQRVQIWPPNSNGGGSKAERFQDVGAPSYAAIKVNFNLSKNFGTNAV